ncbi:sensor histidine kinase [Actinomadura sp. 6N118]|uniref:sensor histidine kinase n=1 Tax=Actinomadura sp. 6N118 TaxID=3375151 RepID=UPI0037B1EDED
MTTLTAALRPTIRVRLALVYGGLFLVGGIVLLALTYFLVRGSLPGGSEKVASGSTSRVTDSGVPPPEGAFVREFREAPPGTVFRSEQVGELLVETRGKTQQATLNALLTYGSIALGLVGAVALGLGWIFADRALRPLHSITETARRVTRSQHLGERIAYTGPHDDVKELADTFDAMLERLARAFDGQRRFVANASHELRTPLAINRTLVDVAVRRSDATDDVKRLGESLLVVNTRHERLIDGLLTLAGTENAVVDRLPLDLAVVAGHVLDQASAEATERGVTTHRRLGPAPTAGDPVLVERLVQNLVENAVRHNTEGGELWVTTARNNGEVELTVANTGPVVPPYETETIFEPFRRLGNDRVRSDRGTGLGLSIVRATATAHGGTVTASPRPEGGLVLHVQLPSFPMRPPSGPPPPVVTSSVTQPSLRVEASVHTEPSAQPGGTSPSAGRWSSSEVIGESRNR